MLVYCQAEIERVKGKLFHSGDTTRRRAFIREMQKQRRFLGVDVYPEARRVVVKYLKARRKGGKT
jgi:hypothetical protein